MFRRSTLFALVIVVAVGTGCPSILPPTEAGQPAAGSAPDPVDVGPALGDNRPELACTDIIGTCAGGAPCPNDPADGPMEDTLAADAADDDGILDPVIDRIGDYAFIMEVNSVYAVHAAPEPGLDFASSAHSFFEAPLLEILANEVDSSEIDVVAFLSLAKLPGWIHSNRLTVPAKNIGLFNSQFDAAPSSPLWPRLRGVLQLNTMCLFEVRRPPESYGEITFAHELGHFWGVYWATRSPGPLEWDASMPVAWLGSGGSHWSWVWDRPFPGVMYSGFTSPELNAFDLYAMGLMPFDEASTYSYVIHDQEHAGGETYSLTLADLLESIELEGAEFFEGDGRRIPELDESARNLKALLVVVKDKHYRLSRAQRNLVANMAHALPAAWQTATWGRSEVAVVTR